MPRPANTRLDNLLASLTANLDEEARRALEDAAGVSGRAADALLGLEEFLDGAYVGRLAEVLGLTHSGAVRVVTLLESAGLAERTAGEDRRRVEVHLTTAGRARAAAARSARDDVVRGATSGLSAKEARALEPLLARLVEAQVTARVARRRTDDAVRGWWCRTCDFTACGRPEGRCPAHETALREMG